MAGICIGRRRLCGATDYVAIDEDIQNIYDKALSRNEPWRIDQEGRTQ